MELSQNPYILALLGVDVPIESVDEAEVEQDLDSLDHEREALLEAQLVREEQEDEVMDLVDFLESPTREMFERDDI